MPEIKRSALLPYPADFMYALVNDVAAYPEFLPWCAETRIHQVDENNMEASILMQKSGLRQWFKTRNQLEPGRSIKMSLLEGPFSQLEGSWMFTPVGESGCKIEFELSFEIRRGLASAIISPAFSLIANSMVESFCARAREIHE